METYFNNKEKAKQLVDYSLLFDKNVKMSCSDIDGVVEYKDKCWIFFEVKQGDKELSLGQKIMYERMVNDLSKVKPAILLVCSHNVDNPEEAIQLRETTVREIFYKGKWNKPSSTLNTKDVMNSFISRCIGGKN